MHVFEKRMFAQPVDRAERQQTVTATSYFSGFVSCAGPEVRSIQDGVMSTTLWWLSARHTPLLHGDLECDGHLEEQCEEHQPYSRS
jgi:hypothetical protein